MTPGDWKEIEDLYLALSGLSGNERQRVLAESGAKDEVRREVESMLARREDLPSFLERKGLDVAAEFAPRHSPGTLAGRRIHHYEVRSFIGAGGFGEVYRARDSRLDRDVALKVLPVQFSGDAERVRRSEREAKLLAALNHPNIAAIYDLAEAGDIRCLVLEFVEGETLSERMKRGRVPLAEAVETGRQIAEALEAAHEQGIVHRDLKPANVMIAANGRIKVLDFGIAKMLEPAVSPNAPTNVDTSAGMVLGTASYMSPEQARGQTVDKRTDVWAFGCVLFEMLSGRKAFDGQTVTDTIASIMTSEPDWALLPPETPSTLRWLLRRCLQKQPKDRLHDIADVRVTLQDAIVEPAVTRPAAEPLRRKSFATAAAALGGVLLGALLVAVLRPVSTPNSAVMMRFTTGFQPASQMSRPIVRDLAISPDGRYLAFRADNNGGSELYIRAVDQTQAVVIPGTLNNSNSPFFSPDSQWLGFWQSGKLRKVPVTGGPSIEICDKRGGPPGGVSWTTNDTIVFSAYPEKGIWAVSAAGGTPQMLIEPDPAKNELAYLSPELTPDGKTLLFTVRTPGTWDEAQIVAHSLETGRRRVLIRGGASVRYAASGHLLYMKAGVLMAVPFNVEAVEPTGPAVSLIPDVMQSMNMVNSLYENGIGQFTVSNTGILAFLSGGTYPPEKRQLTLIDRQGREDVLPASPASPVAARFSPDGARIAYTAGSATTRQNDIWTYDVQRRNSRRITSNTANGPYLVWSPDSDRLVFSSGAAGPLNLQIVNADVAAEATRLTTSEHHQHASSWTGRGNRIAFVETHRPSEGDQIHFLAMDEQPGSKPILHSKFDFLWPDFSADGNWLAYASNETNRFEVYVQRHPPQGSSLPISIDGGTAPVWRRDGKEIFYLHPGGSPQAPIKVMSVQVETSAEFKASRPAVLFETANLYLTTPVRSYDISPDGRRFVFVRRVSDPPKPLTEIHFITNWFEELRRRAPASDSN